MKIQIVYTGRSYQTAEELPSELTLAEHANVDDALAEIAHHLGDDSPLPASCLVAVCGEHVGTVASHANRQLNDGDELVLIAPVAGG
jgi:molybdopterin converting factor small subunit